jgi:hypothetical protein
MESQLASSWRKFADLSTSAGLSAAAIQGRHGHSGGIHWRKNLIVTAEHTMKFHVATVLSKLGASSRTEAVSIAMRRGMPTIERCCTRGGVHSLLGQN